MLRDLGVCGSCGREAFEWWISESGPVAVSVRCWQHSGDTLPEAGSWGRVPRQEAEELLAASEVLDS